MRAITVVPGQRGSAALTEMPEPPPEDGPILVETRAIGICGTDVEIISGDYGWAPPGQERLIIGHESLGQVIEAAPETGFAAGDQVVGIVRRRDPVPCPACAIGDWDMCTNGRYTERGIKARHGYASERYRIHPEYLVAVDPALASLGVLLEPATVVAKAWDHIEKIGRRAAWTPGKVLITGAGPIGLLAALLSTQRGYDTYVVDLVTEGRKPEMVRELGATYFHSGDIVQAAAEADIVIECTGFVQLLLEAGPQHVRHRITCLTGVSAVGTESTVDSGLLNRNMVLQNSVLFGSVNANRRHYELAAQALSEADPDWLGGLITRQVPVAQWADAYDRRPGDIKTVLNFQDGTLSGSGTQSRASRSLRAVTEPARVITCQFGDRSGLARSRRLLAAGPPPTIGLALGAPPPARAATSSRTNYRNPGKSPDGCRPAARPRRPAAVKTGGSAGRRGLSRRPVPRPRRRRGRAMRGWWQQGAGVACGARPWRRGWPDSASPWRGSREPTVRSGELFLSPARCATWIAPRVRSTAPGPAWQAGAGPPGRSG